MLNELAQDTHAFRDLSDWFWQNVTVFERFEKLLGHIPTEDERIFFQDSQQFMSACVHIYQNLTMNGVKVLDPLFREAKSFYERSSPGLLLPIESGVPLYKAMKAKSELFIYAEPEITGFYLSPENMTSIGPKNPLAYLRNKRLYDMAKGTLTSGHIFSSWRSNWQYELSKRRA